MLAEHTPIANVATSDLTKARAFYEGVLGFRPVHESSQAGVVIYSVGTGNVMVYVSQFAGTNKATAFGFELALSEFDQEIAALRAAGVSFETFELPGLTWDDGVAVSEGGQGKAAWFRDPDGNTIGITAGSMG